MFQPSRIDMAIAQRAMKPITPNSTTTRQPRPRPPSQALGPGPFPGVIMAGVMGTA
jgi:hypothetical protein